MFDLSQQHTAMLRDQILDLKVRSGFHRARAPLHVPAGTVVAVNGALDERDFVSKRRKTLVVLQEDITGITSLQAQVRVQRMGSQGTYEKVPISKVFAFYS